MDAIKILTVTHDPTRAKAPPAKRNDGIWGRECD